MRVGFARTVITPPPGASLAGFGARQERAQGVHDDLHARALVLEASGQRVALVVCDLCDLDAGFIREARRRIQERTGIPAASALLAATHTHAAPATFALYSLPPDPGWLDDLAGRAADAVASAVRDLTPATLGLALGRENSVGRNRRRPDGPVDPTVTVLRAERVDASPALLVHYACHPTVLGPDNLMISRDYVGFTVDAVERATGGWVMFANGACGDINVGHSADRSALGLPIPGRTFERAEELGLRLAGEAVRALTDTRPVAGWRAPGHGMLAAGRRSLVVPLRPTPPLEQVRAQVRACRRHLETLQAAGANAGADDAEVTAARLELLYAELALSWVEQRTRAEGAGAAEETAEVQAFAVGDVALVGLPGEFFVESGLRLQNRSPFKHTIVVGYANGGIGYVPPASAFAEGGYETRLAPWSRVAPEAEGLILDAAASLLDGLRDQQDERPG
ncbi:MAG: neutral/alkaline non-lysosomal ceramidase N-terminal domain-containing protein [bacterium]|nr:neutral/alkaline non-lysosomal ceramidase N-terminal domain-containing protein [bacterium]